MKIDISKSIPVFAFLMAFFLPLHIGLSNLFLILIFVASFVLFVFQKSFVMRSPKTLVYTTLPFFILYILGLFYSEPAFMGTKVLGQSVAFLLCPVLLLFLPWPILNKMKSALKLGIVVGSVISITLLLANTLLNYYATRPFPSIDDELFSFYYTYYKFTEPFVEFAAYLGAYVVLAMAILIDEWFKKEKFKFWIGFSLLILSIGIVFINARITIFLYMVLIVIAVLRAAVQWYGQKKYLSVGLMASGSLMVGVFVFQLLSNSFVATRFTDELKWELSEQIGSGYNEKFVAESRISRWKVALDLIVEKPLFGHGTYSEKQALAEQYEKHQMWASLANRYDAHNMYLSFGIEYGIVGVALFLFFIIKNAIVAIRNKDAIFAFFVFMIATISVFESYFLNNAGITYVALFVAVFFYENLFQPKEIKDGSQ